LQMKIRLRRPSGYFWAAIMAVAGVLTGAIIAGVKAGTIVVLVFGGFGLCPDLGGRYASK